ncbi:hypothetical protein GQ42DRAFT_160678 [Ramicandelaber brevisporus]|nr:hypothetical protein GQ42DRAFT_160678 [Ramicandelaber brevisporus]
MSSQTLSPPTVLQALPLDVLYLVTSYLDFRSLLSFSECNSTARELVAAPEHDSAVWKPLCARRGVTSLDGVAWDANLDSEKPLVNGSASKTAKPSNNNNPVDSVVNKYIYSIIGTRGYRALYCRLLSQYGWLVGWWTRTDPHTPANGQVVRARIDFKRASIVAEACKPVNAYNPSSRGNELMWSEVMDEHYRPLELSIVGVRLFEVLMRPEPSFENLRTKTNNKKKNKGHTNDTGRVVCLMRHAYEYASSHRVELDELHVSPTASSSSSSNGNTAGGQVAIDAESASSASSEYALFDLAVRDAHHSAAEAVEEIMSSNGMANGDGDPPMFRWSCAKDCHAESSQFSDRSRILVTMGLPHQMPEPCKPSFRRLILPREESSSAAQLASLDQTWTSAVTDECDAASNRETEQLVPLSGLWACDSDSNQCEFVRIIVHQDSAQQRPYMSCIKVSGQGQPDARHVVFVSRIDEVLSQDSSYTTEDETIDNMPVTTYGGYYQSSGHRLFGIDPGDLVPIIVYVISPTKMYVRFMMQEGIHSYVKV